MERILAILSSGEDDYGRELASYMGTRADCIFKPVVFTDINAYRRYEGSNHVDMLLCSDELMAEAKDGFQSENICLLSECSTLNEHTDYPIIFKYQSSERILQQVIEYYGRRRINPKEGSPGETGCRRIVSVCSPMGGCHSSTYALALAEYYSRGGRTLFISFDPFFLLPGETKKTTDKNLTDVLYFLQIYSGNPTHFIEKIVRHRGNLDYISGVSHWFDLADMTTDQMRRLFEGLIGSGCYENVVFDVGIIGSASIELLAGSRTIHMPVRSGNGYRRITDEWRRQLCFSGQEDIAQKVVERKIPADEGLTGDYRFDDLLSGVLGEYIEETEGLHYLK